jgi:hypothetical protein
MSGLLEISATSVCKPRPLSQPIQLFCCRQNPAMKQKAWLRYDGINPSSVFRLAIRLRTGKRTVGSYISTMVHLVEHVHKSVNGMVLLIPNEISSGANDDARIAEKVHEQVAGQNCQIVPSPRLRAQEAQGDHSAMRSGGGGALSHHRCCTVARHSDFGDRLASQVCRCTRSFWSRAVVVFKSRICRSENCWKNSMPCGRIGRHKTEQIRRNLEPVKQLVRDAAEQVGRFIQQRTFADSRSLQ